MKIYKYILIVLTVFFLSQMARSQSYDENLIGSWTFDFQASFDGMSQNSKTHYNGLKQSSKSRILNAYSQRTITFNSNGTFVQTLGSEKVTNANWSITNTNVTITTTSGNTFFFTIKELQTSTLMLEQVNTSGINVLFSTWYLTKN